MIPKIKLDLINKIIKSNYFTKTELVCSHIVDFYNGDSIKCLNELSYGVLHTIYSLRVNLGVPLRVNNYGIGLSQRGKRCNLCELVKNKKGVTLSKHNIGEAIDVSAVNEKYTKKQIFDHIYNNQHLYPYIMRLEKLDDQNRVHFDTSGSMTREANEKIYVFS